jgi:NAD(P)H-quinone oxidoreductase subunit 5
VLVLLIPVVIERIDPFLALPSFSSTSTLLVVGSGLAGVLGGVLVQLDAFRSRSLFRPLRMLQDLLAYDFYTEGIYKATIVAFVAGLARLTNSVDRDLVNGLVNRIGSASLASAEGLKLGVSGQLQSYVLTLVSAIIMLLASLSWLKG